MTGGEAEATSAAYLLVFRETSPERYEEVSREERRAALERWNAWCDGLLAEGRLQAGNTLAPEGRVISRAGGTRAVGSAAARAPARGTGRVVDGPFAEAKELIGGYILLRAASLEEAVAIAEGCPNLPYGMEVEVRPVAEACHLARSLGWATMRGPAAQAV
jgi:hypothetical protein